MTDHIIDKSPAQKQMHAEKLRAALIDSLRQSVPSVDAPSYWSLGWTYIMPDFDRPNHSIVEWQSDKIPMYPPRSNQPQPREHIVWTRRRDTTGNSKN